MNSTIKGALPARTRAGRSAAESGGGFVRGLVWGLIACVASGVLLLLAGALIAYKSPDPDALIAPLGFGALVLACLLGGVGVGLGCRSGVLPCSVVLACTFLGLELVLSLLFGIKARQELSLGLGLGASLGLRTGLAALICAASVLSAQIKGKIQGGRRRPGRKK